MAPRGDGSRTWTQWAVDTEHGSLVSVFVICLVLGSILGAAIPPGDSYPDPWGRVSSTVGWVYFTAWSVSFYPQVISNYHRKSVEGLSFEYVSLNLVGFTCYSAFNAALYWNPTVRAQYVDRFGSNPAVQLNDVFFGFHAVLLTAVNIGQIFIYERGGQTLAKWAMLLIFLMVSSSAGFAVAVAAGASGPYTSWLDFFTYLSYVKLAVTLTKYTPQAVLNCRRRSTEGWSVTNVLLDWTGGILSIAQLLLDCGVTGQWSGVAGDPVKFALGFTSMVFDIVFMAQHYCLFPKGGDVGGSYEAVGDYVPGLGGGFDEEGGFGGKGRGKGKGSLLR